MLGLRILPGLALFLSAVQAIPWTATPFNPPAFPLAVRSPYLSAWLPQGPGAALNDAWPTFWTGQILGWAGFVKVDGKAYCFLGAPNVPRANFTKATQKMSKFTPTQSIFVLSAGPVDITVTFLNPIEPTDLVKQATPFSYLSVSAVPTDGSSHSVQVYSDISGEWVSGDNNLVANWSTYDTGSTITHQIQLQTQSPFSEIKDRVQDGSAFYSTPNTPHATYQTGSDLTVRAEFIANGRLLNTQDTSFREINSDWPILALSRDLGNITRASDPVVFSVGHIRDPAIQYVVSSGVQERFLYFWSRFSSADDVINSFLGDFKDALLRAEDFDDKLQSDASKISPDYASIVALSTAQAFGSMEITMSMNPDKSWDTSDVLVFMKEISSDGNVNTVDVIFPTWPMLLYTNPALCKYLLEGLLRYHVLGLYPNKWSIHDLGSHYPNATGHKDGKDEAMPLEESGNMIIMALSYALKTADLSYIRQYSNLLDQWAQFLISESLIPSHQISSDDFAGPLANQTNLAVKGIIGIRAMGEIWSLLGDSDKASHYSIIATSYVTQWYDLAISSDGRHLTLSYGNSSSWGLTYNLYADKLLKLNLFPASVYTLQTNWYRNVADTFGIPLDTRHTYTKSDWQLWTASIASDTPTRDLFISSVREWAASGLSSQPFGDWYDTKSGRPLGFRARPVVGGHFAPLLLTAGSTTTTPSPVSTFSTIPTSSASSLGDSFFLGLGISILILILGVEQALA